VARLRLTFLASHHAAAEGPRSISDPGFWGFGGDVRGEPQRGARIPPSTGTSEQPLFSPARSAELVAGGRAYSVRWSVWRVFLERGKHK
jgi:hypothetical protein